MIRPIILSLSLFGLMNCQTQKNKATTSTTSTSTSSSSSSSNAQNTSMKKTILTEGEYTKIQGTDINAKYIGIVEDSRCPEGATCVWAGVAIVEIEVMTPTSRPKIIQLATMNVSGKDAQKTATVDDYTLTLDAVSRNLKASEKNNIGISAEKNK